MSSSREQAVLSLLDSARKQSDALIVVAIAPQDRIFYSVDDRLTLPDLHETLERNLDFICESVARFRARRAKERRSS